ncbi:MAG: hypothetical protein ACE5F7_05515, partial [Nitrospiria bacterium]
MLNQTRAPSSRFLLFPVVSLIVHIAFFLIFVTLEIGHGPAKITEDEVIAMVDLSELPPSPETPPMIPELTAKAPTADPPESLEAPESTAEPESPETAVQEEPMLDPELDEEPEALEEELMAATADTAGPHIVPPAVPEMSDALSEAEADSEPVSPESAFDDLPEETEMEAETKLETSEPEPAQEALAMNKPAPSEPPDTPE